MGAPVAEMPQPLAWEESPATGRRGRRGAVRKGASPTGVQLVKPRGAVAAGGAPLWGHRGSGKAPPCHTPLHPGQPGLWDRNHRSRGCNLRLLALGREGARGPHPHPSKSPEREGGLSP